MELLNTEEILNIEDNFVHLHVHTDYSFLDGFNKASRAAARAKELGMKAMACTDHNHVAGVLDFQAAMREEGIKPILGCEMYWTWDTNILSKSKDERDAWAIEQARKVFDIDKAIHDLTNPVSEKTGKALKPKKLSKADLSKLIDGYEYDTTQYHVLFLAINQTGWSNLVKMQSEAAEKCTFNGRYCCDDEMIRKYSEGIIMTSACVGNPINEMINAGEYEKAERQVDIWHEIFGDRFYLEIQPLRDLDLQHRANLQLIQYAKQKNIKLVASNDVHYTLKEDYDDHDTLLCVGIGKCKCDENRMHYAHSYWIKSYQEMVEGFYEQAQLMEELYGPEIVNVEEYMEVVREALANTNEIADMIEDIKLGSDVNLFPNIEIPFGLSSEAYLEMKCFQELYKYKAGNQDIHLPLYVSRLREELHVINTKGFAPYILVVQDYIDWANNNGCPTGPGRGSGAGSLVLFLLGITKIIDPIKYGLLFFRFLTMDRSAPPDIDTDFEYYNRERVVQYMQEKYGNECVAHIGSFSELGVKSGIKDIGRALEIDYAVCDEISKKIDVWLDKPDLKFKDLDKLKESDRPYEQEAWAEFNSYEKKYPELFRLARRFEGTPRNYGVHASGILITPMPISELFPTRYKDGITITLYNGVQLEDLKAIKFDVLGLKTLSVIKNTLEAIDENLSMDDLYKMVDIDDPEMFEMIQGKQTDGLFQIESGLFKGMIEKIVPSTMNDIVVITSLGRPGPLQAGMDKSYAERKHGEQEAVEPLPGTWEVVSDTHGTICYQEQIMIISKIVAGFDDNQSDSYLRKAFAKKKKDKMTQCRQWFIYGKRNESAPEGYDEANKNQPEYDPNGKHGPAIIGGIANGYTEKVLADFWANIEGFADYLFNKSHAACYSYITVLTGWLKKYHNAKFMASLISVQEKEQKIDNYVKVARTFGCEVKVPSINKSGKDFTADGSDILYGFGSIKGVGEKSIPEILANQPYASIEDFVERVSKKDVNKTVVIALAKAGAFDEFESNRNVVINKLYDLRKDKVDKLVPDDWNEELCITYEKETMGTPITFIPWWDEVVSGQDVTVELEIQSVEERPDKKGNMMGFMKGTYGGCLVDCLIFSRTYCSNSDKFDMQFNTHITVKGKKEDKGKLLINKVISSRREMPPTEMDDLLEGLVV